MNHLIIYAHPNTNSFTSGISEAVRNFSMEQEYKTEFRDLYSIGFDPVLSASELLGIASSGTSEDVKREYSYIEWADIITFVYPIWWTGMPAILKGYIDRVFLYSVACKQGKNKSERTLKDKKVFIFNSMGTPNEVYNKNSMTKAMKLVCDDGIFNFCGMKIEQHAFFGGVSNLDQKTVKKYLEAVPEIYLRSLKPKYGNSSKNNNSSNGNEGSSKNNKNNNNNKN